MSLPPDYEGKMYCKTFNVASGNSSVVVELRDTSGNSLECNYVELIADTTTGTFQVYPSPPSKYNTTVELPSAGAGQPGGTGYASLNNKIVLNFKSGEGIIAINVRNNTDGTTATNNFVITYGNVRKKNRARMGELEHSPRGQ